MEIARLGEAKLTEVEKISSQIGDNIESSFANNRDIASSWGESSDVRNGEKMVVLNGPIGPPRNLDPSIGGAPSMSLPPSGSRNLGSTIGMQRPRTSPTQSVWFPKEPSQGQSGSSVARLGPARSFDVDFASSEIPSTGSSQTSNSRRSIMENARPLSSILENKEVSNQQVRAANTGSPSGDEARSLLHLREDNNRATVGNVSGRIEGSHRRLLVDGDADIVRKPGSAIFDYEDSELKYDAENAGFYHSESDRVIPPLWRRRAHRRHWMRNEW